MTQPRKRSLSAKGSLSLLVVLLAGSAIVRIGVGANSALAEVDLTAGFPLPLASQMSQDVSAPEAEVDVQPLLDALRAREQQVSEREGQMDARSKALDVAQQEVERRLAALESAEKRLRDTLSIAQTAAEDDLANLTIVYENMKPKDASELFEAMEPAFAAGFLGRMQPEAAAKIMAGLDPQAAYSISAILAGRNARAPKN